MKKVDLKDTKFEFLFGRLALVLTTLFAVLRYYSIISWDWVWVVSPAVGSVIITLAFYVAVTALAVIMALSGYKVTLDE